MNDEEEPRLIDMRKDDAEYLQSIEITPEYLEKLKRADRLSLHKKLFSIYATLLIIAIILTLVSSKLNRFCGDENFLEIIFLPFVLTAMSVVIVYGAVKAVQARNYRIAALWIIFSVPSSFIALVIFIFSSGHNWFCNFSF